MPFDVDASSFYSDAIRGVPRIDIDAWKVFGSGHLHLSVCHEFLNFHVEDVTVGENLIGELFTVFKFKRILDEWVHTAHDQY